MKKKIRFLPLVLSLLLLCATAFPASAVEVVPDPYEYFNPENPPAWNYVASDTDGAYTYSIETTRLEDNEGYHYFVDDEYHYTYSDSTFIEGILAANEKTWEGSGNFDSAHHTALTNLAERVGIAYRVSNHEHEYSFEVTCDRPFGIYAVMLSCFHYDVATRVTFNGNQASYHFISEMPFIYGEYLYLEFLG